MPKQRLLLTNWSKGELSPLLESRSDLAGYYEGASNLTNFLVSRQGGVKRRSGTRFVQRTKTDLDTILIPFEFSVEQSYMLEFGHHYIRVFKNKAPLLSGGVQVEIVTPYEFNDLRLLHFTQSADVLFLFHPAYQQRTLSRSNDAEWALSLFVPTPPPSFEADMDAGLIAPAAHTGTGVSVYSTTGIFLAGDVGRQLISGASSAVIVSFVDVWHVTVDILGDFTNPITPGPNDLTSVGTTVTSISHGASVGDWCILTAGAQTGEAHLITNVIDAHNFTLSAAFAADQAAPVSWNRLGTVSAALRLTPYVTLDPNLSGPLGAQVTLVAGAACFRAGDVGKFIKILGGGVKITVVDSDTQVRGTLLSAMGEATVLDPAAVPAGAWTLEDASWSAANGYPRTGEFYQGRLYQAGTFAQPTTFWGSASDDYYNYALGVSVENAVEYTVASRQVNQVQWIADNVALILGTGGSEHRAFGSGNDNALIGGDNIPMVERVTTHGCAAIQPIVANRQVVFVDRSRKKVFAIGFDVLQDGYDTKELTVLSEHIMNLGVRLGPIGYTKRPDPRLYFVTEGGTLASLTYFMEQKILAFSSFQTAGAFEAVAVIPDVTDTEPDQVWVIAQRIVNGEVARYIEVVEEHDPALASRQWQSYQTDSALVIAGTAPAMTFTAPHLAGNDVQIVADGVSRGTVTLDSAGSTILEPPATVVEMGLLYQSTLQSMRPAIQNGPVIDGVMRSWDAVFVRLLGSAGGTLQFQPIPYEPVPGGGVNLVSREFKVNVEPNADTLSWLNLQQNDPYPMIVSGLYGTLNIGDYD